MRLLGMLAADAVRDRIGPDPLARLIGRVLGRIADRIDCALYDGGEEES